MAPDGLPLPVHPVKMGEDQVRPHGLGGVDQGLRGLGMDAVVPVHELEILPPCQGQGGVPGGGDPGVLLPEEAEAGIGHRHIRADGGGAVGAAIVHHQHLQVPPALALDALQARGEIGFHIIDRDDDTHQRFVQGGHLATS